MVSQWEESQKVQMSFEMQKRRWRKNTKKYNQMVRRVGKIILFLVYLSKSTNRRQIELLISDLLAQLMMTGPHNCTFSQWTSQSPDHRVDNWVSSGEEMLTRRNLYVLRRRQSLIRSLFWHFGSDWGFGLLRGEVWLRNSDGEFLKYEMTTLTLLSLIKMYLDNGLLLCSTQKDEESQSWLHN